MTRDEVARIAKLAGIEKDHEVFFSVGEEEMDVHIDDLKRFAELVLEARAEKQEHLCHVCQGRGDVETGIMESPVTICNSCNGTGYSAPPQRQPLNFEQRMDIVKKCDGSVTKGILLTEAAHGIKGET